MPAQPTKKIYLKKILASALLGVTFVNILIVGIFWPTQQAQAVVPTLDATLATLKAESNTGDAGWFSWEKIEQAFQGGQLVTMVGTMLWDKAEYLLQQALKVAWDLLRRRLLNMLVNDIVKWIQGGGEPRFVTDWQGFLKTAADAAAGDFVKYKLGLGFLCGPFALKLQIALARPQTFSEAASCTLSQIGTNIDNFFANFSSGGWRGWIAVSEPGGNIFGATLLALDEKYDLMAKAKEAAQNEAGSAAGFLGDKVCAQRQCTSRATNQILPVENYSGSSLGWTKENLNRDGAICDCLRWESRTPGRAAGDALQQAAGIDIELLISAKEFSEYAGAIIDAIINRVIREGVLLLTSTGEGTSDSYSAPGAPVVPGVNAPSYVSANLSTINAANENIALLPNITQQEELLIENLNATLSEYQTNLGLANQIKASQERAIAILNETASENCALPANTSMGAETTVNQNNCAAANCPCTTISTSTQAFTINGLGSGTLEIVTTNQYVMGEADWFGAATCNSLSSSIITSSIKDSSLSSLNAINQIQNDILALQTTIAQVNSTLTDSLAYETALTAYTDAYDALQRKTGTQAAVDAAEATMEETKTTALASLQALTNNPSADLNVQQSAIMQLSIAAVGETGDAQTDRGFSVDCAFIDAGTYHGDLCASQAKETELQNNLDACLQARQQAQWQWP